jgi:hypothetical protein
VSELVQRPQPAAAAAAAADRPHNRPCNRPHNRPHNRHHNRHPDQHCNQIVRLLGLDTLTNCTVTQSRLACTCQVRRSTFSFRLMRCPTQPSSPTRQSYFALSCTNNLHSYGQITLRRETKERPLIYIAEQFSYVRTNQQNPEPGCLDLLASGNSLALFTAETFLQLPGVFFGPCSFQTEPSQLGQRQRLAVILSRCCTRRRTRLRNIGWRLGLAYSQRCRRCRKRRTEFILRRGPKLWAPST